MTRCKREIAGIAWLKRNGNSDRLDQAFNEWNTNELDWTIPSSFVEIKRVSARLIDQEKTFEWIFSVCFRMHSRKGMVSHSFICRWAALASDRWICALLLDRARERSRCTFGHVEFPRDRWTKTRPIWYSRRSQTFTSIYWLAWKIRLDDVSVVSPTSINLDAKRKERFSLEFSMNSESLLVSSEWSFSPLSIDIEFAKKFRPERSEFSAKSFP